MDKLWQKITSGWHVMRLFYLAGGLMIFIQGIIVHEWPGLLLEATLHSWESWGQDVSVGNAKDKLTS